MARFGFRRRLARSHEAIRLVLKLIAVYGVWYLVYDLWLLPDGHVDRWMAHHIASLSGGLLSLFGFDPFVHERLLWLANTPGLEVIDSCTGLRAMGRFAGLLLVLPGRRGYRWAFLAAGVLVLHAANVGRVAVLAVLQRHAPFAFEVVHDVGAPLFFYALVLLLWHLWIDHAKREQRLPSFF